MTIAGVMLLAAAPALALVALAVRIDLGRPICFRQDRPGLAGRTFSIVKFRTMLAGDSTSDPRTPDKDRITSVGAWLRKTSLDELPELILVLVGTMSLVGPRPLLPEYLPYYSEVEKKRFLVLPGMTGLAQISGRNCLDWDSRLARDVEFVEKFGPRLYFSILLRTPWAVLTSKGVAVDAYSVALPLHIERSAKSEVRNG